MRITVGFLNYHNLDLSTIMNTDYDLLRRFQGDNILNSVLLDTVSWRAGRIETNIHNPHYYEWMRRTGNEIPANHNEVQCGREIDHCEFLYYNTDDNRCNTDYNILLCVLVY